MSVNVLVKIRFLRMFLRAVASPGPGGAKPPKKYFAPPP